MTRLALHSLLFSVFQGFFPLLIVRKYHVSSFILWLFQASWSLRTARTDVLPFLVLLELHMR